MSLKKATKKKPTKKATAPIRFRFVSDDDCHNYLIPAELEDKFKVWLDCGQYWDGYEGEYFDIYRIDGVSDYTFTDPRSDR